MNNIKALAASLLLLLSSAATFCSQEKQKILKRNEFSAATDNWDILTLNSQTGKLKTSSGYDMVDVRLNTMRDHLTMLMVLAQNNTPGLQEGLRHSKNLEITDDQGWTALFHAINSDSYERVRMLVDAGANPNHVNRKNFDALYHALCISKSPEMIEYLLQNGAKSNNPAIITTIACTLNDPVKINLLLKYHINDSAENIERAITKAEAAFQAGLFQYSGLCSGQTAQRIRKNHERIVLALRTHLQHHQTATITSSSSSSSSTGHASSSAILSASSSASTSSTSTAVIPHVTSLTLTPVVTKTEITDNVTPFPKKSRKKHRSRQKAQKISTFIKKASSLQAPTTRRPTTSSAHALNAKSKEDAQTNVKSSTPTKSWAEQQREARENQKKEHKEKERQKKEKEKLKAQIKQQLRIIDRLMAEQQAREERSSKTKSAVTQTSNSKAALIQQADAILTGIGEDLDYLGQFIAAHSKLAQLRRQAKKTNSCSENDKNSSDSGSESDSDDDEDSDSEGSRRRDAAHEKSKYSDDEDSKGERSDDEKTEVKEESE